VLCVPVYAKCIKPTFAITWTRSSGQTTRVSTKAPRDRLASSFPFTIFRAFFSTTPAQQKSISPILSPPKTQSCSLKSVQKLYCPRLWSRNNISSSTRWTRATGTKELREFEYHSRN
jgi:hypothetical protein